MKNQICFGLLVVFLLSCGGNKKTNNLKNQSSEKTYKIAYNVYVDDSLNKDDYEIFIMNMDGSEKRNITANKDVAWTYYAYRDKIYFISDRDTAYRKFFLYVMDADGENVRKVSDLAMEDSWMGSRNNGTEMIVAGRPDKETRYQFFILNLTDGSYKQITNDSLGHFRDPVFSPDGNQIAFAFKKNRYDRGEHEELFIMNADGSNMKQLTHYPENDSGLYSYHYKAGPPRWHPTENFISYQSFQNGKYSLYAVTPDGEKQWKLTDNPLQEGWHDWSNDGKWLAIELFDTASVQFNIGLMNWETKELKILTDSTFKFQQAPVFVEIIEPES